MQARPTPDVVTGARGQVALSELQRPDQPSRDVTRTAPAREGEVVYHSHARNLIVQITSPQDTLDPSTGRFIRRDGKRALFRDGEYRTTDAESIATLDSNPRCHVGGLYWRADQLQAAVQKAKDDEIREFVMKNPERISAILQDLGSKQYPEDAVAPAAAK